ncbi:MAG: hypothetical protein LBG49_02420 [Mycoplasmataceae bacterium]|nr:hypothetical protein [Mycoplasmataceae bacterium]
MNFVALIGIVESVKNNSSSLNTIINIKVEKPYVDDKEDDWYELVSVFADKETFKEEIKQTKKDSIIGIKGRLTRQENDPNKLVRVICERLQVF